MKKKYIQCCIILMLLLTSCSDKSIKGDLAFIDVGKNYPEKETLLTDIADVTYIHLNSDDDNYLYGGVSYRTTTENRIVIGDGATGSILFFSKDGNPVSRFNRKGRGPQDYLDANQIIYDEVADEVFIFSFSTDFLQVYSSTGEYKRKIVLPQGTIVNRYFSFDDESLFIYDESRSNERKAMLEQDGRADLTNYENQSSPFFLISKTDGKVLEYVEIPSAPTTLLGAYSKVLGQYLPGRAARIIKSKEGVLLCNPETDTVFLYSYDKVLTPVIYKIPSVSATPPQTYLNNCIDVGSYQFMEVTTIREDEFPYPSKYYIREKSTGEIFHQKIVLPDYPDYKGREIYFGSMWLGLDYENGPCFELRLFELKQAYRENKLNGKLKELVATLDEDKDNNVLMIINFNR